MIYPIFVIGGFFFWLIIALVGLGLWGLFTQDQRSPWSPAFRIVGYTFLFVAAFSNLFPQITFKENPVNPTLLHPVFLYGTFPFWALVVALNVYILWCMSAHRGTYADVAVVVFLPTLQFFSDIPIFVWMWERWDLTLLYVGIWLLCSIPWAVIKWWMFTRDHAMRYDELLKEFMENHTDWPQNAAEWTAEMKVIWRDYFLRHAAGDDPIEFRPTTNQHKADIMVWMGFWPWSAGWTILSDPLRKIIQQLYYSIVGWLDKITAYYWDDKANHMPTEGELKKKEK